MNPDDDDAVINQLKHPRLALEVLPKSGIEYLRSTENRKLRHDCRPNADLQAYAEDELVRKKYHELRCEMPGTPRSTFLMVFSPDGTKVASTHGNHNIYVTDLRSGRNIRTLVGHPRTPWCIAFHPTCNELVASGCLGGQVRIWDLSGGSEVWTAGSQTVIASIAFHPCDRILVIATYNELYFWDWSKPQPFTQTATCNTKEKVRYVAFDRLGHKLITGIANTPQSRWERSRANTSQSRVERTRSSVSVPAADRSISPYRRRPTPRFVSCTYSAQPSTSNTSSDRVPLSSVPERERRITACYRNLVHEYELLVHRYLQVYRPPTTMDRGTDPMELEQPVSSDTQNPGPSTSNYQRTSPTQSSNAESAIPGPSTSGTHLSPPSTSTIDENLRPRRFISPTLCRSKSTSSSSTGTNTSGNNSNQTSMEMSPRRRLVMRSTLGVQTSTDSPAEPSTSSSNNSDNTGFKMRIKCSPRRRVTNSNTTESLSDTNLKSLKVKLTQMQKNLTQSCNNQINDMAPKIAEFKNSQSAANRLTRIGSIDAPSTSVQAEPENSSQTTQPTNTERQADNRDPWRLQLKRLYPGFIKKTTKQNRKPVLDTSSDNSSSDDEDVVKKRLYCPYSQSTTASTSANSNEVISVRSSQNPPNQTAPNSGFRGFPAGCCYIHGTMNCSSLHSASENVSARTGPVCQPNRCYSHGGSRNNLDRLVCLSDFVANIHSYSAERRSSADSICDRCGGNIEIRAEPTTTTSDTPSTSDSTRLTEENFPTEAEATTSTTTINTSTRMTPTTETQTNAVPPESTAGHSGNTEPSEETDGCARTDVHVTQPCARTLMNTDTRTTNSTVYTPSSGPRRRFFSHVLSAFLPTRVHNVLPQMRPRRSQSFVDPLTRASGRLSANFAPDEVINYSERVNSEDDLIEQPSNLNEFHPFDPPPEFPSINPENIGIGNMYSNIVQDLESSLNNVRNIRASNRPGETSDMLSSFSERLESIMHQSDSILRNLRHTMDMLPPNSEPSDTRRAQRTSPALQLPSPRNIEVDHPRFLFNDPNFYVRDQNQSTTPDRNSSSNRSDVLESLSPGAQHEELYSNRSAIASDHTYPRNPESPRTLPPASDNLTPLMTSLHLTISHIQRQARLLRRQVESIERIDRAMLEVAQLQMIRQMFGEIRRHLTNLSGSDNRSTGVSSVRQMMAGTRISDSSPCDSPVEDEASQNRSSSVEQNNNPVFGDASTSSSSNINPLPSNPSSSQIPRQRVTARKPFSPSRLIHIQRQNRRFSVVNLIPRRYTPRDRLTRRRVYFRTFSVRPSAIRSNNDVVRFQSESGRTFGNVTHVNSETLVMMTRRLEQLLTEHIRLIGRPADLHARDTNAANNDGRETTIIERLNACRVRMNRLSGHNVNSNLNQNPRIEISSVTPDGFSRFNARDTLSAILDTLSRFFDENSTSSISQSLRSQIRNVIDLTSLLSDILLLHIVDSIPPPTGMNLDPERESLSARIDQMCSRMLQSRLSGQSHSLTRSLRLMRLTARYASRALGQTYNARRNAIFLNGNSSRRELIGQINSTLHSIHRNRSMSYTAMDAPSGSESVNADVPMREWYRTINALVSRYNSVSSLINPSSSSASSTTTGHNTRFGERGRSRIGLWDDLTTNSDDNDDNEPDWYNNNLPNDRRQLLYRTNNVNLLNSEAIPFSSQNRPWNVPTVQINDVPISESSSAWHSRLTQHRYRLSDLRANSSGNLFRPRFLHPLYAGVNPFDADLDDPQREQMYDGDMILTVTPNHRIQAWDISSGNIPDISNSMKNVVVPECKIHNDASVDISADGTILVTLLPSGGYLNVTNRLGVYSLRWETLGQCLYITSFEQNAVSVSLSPLSRHLVVGLASRRVSIVPNDKWTMARIFLLNQNEMPYGSRLPVLRELEQNRDTNYMSLNCIRWLPVSGQGLIYATNTGQLRILT